MWNQRRQADKVIVIQNRLTDEMYKAVYHDNGIRINRYSVLSAWCAFKADLQDAGLYDTVPGVQARQSMRKFILHVLKESRN